MKTSETQAIPQSPSLIMAMRAGFDAITNNLVLLLFPVILDVLLWLGPHLRLSNLIHLAALRLMPTGIQEPATVEMLKAGQEAWELLAQRFNLLTTLRSYPVGVPSLMASQLPISTPAGNPLNLEFDTVALVILGWIGLTLAGLLAGTLYFLVVSQAALLGQVDWRQAFQNWPQSSLQVFLLTLFWTGLVVAASIPGGCILASAFLTNLSYTQCALLLYAGFLMWLIFPLFFSPHGIFVNQKNVSASLKASVRMTRFTLPTTAMFVLVAILLTKGLDLLWQVPQETSWLVLIGIFGHAFVTTGLLAASFVYYRDADSWAQSLTRHMKFASIQKI